MVPILPLSPVNATLDEVPAGRDPYEGQTFRQWWLVTTLTTTLTMAVIDRTILSLLFDSIRTDLGLSDSQMALVIGTAFALSSSLFILPAGYLTDRISRRRMIAAASLIWSVMTATCGLAGGFGQLLLARTGVGSAEAVINPGAFSMLRAALPPQRRGRGFAIYASGIPLGGGLGLVLGAGLLHLISQHGIAYDVPGIGLLKPWRLVMLFLGLIGLPITLIMLTVHEPRRGGHSSISDGNWLATFQHLGRRWKLFVPLFIFVVFGSMHINAYQAFMATIPVRRWGLAMTVVGRTIGLLALVGAPLGLWSTGIAMDFLTRRMGPSGPVILAIMTGVITFGVSVATVLAATPAQYFVTLFVLFFIGGSSFAIAGNILVSMTPENIVGKTAAVQLLLSGLIGNGLGPALVGVISDHLSAGKGRAGLSTALGSVGSVFSLLALSGACLLLLALREKSFAPSKVSE